MHVASPTLGRPCVRGARVYLELSKLVISRVVIGVTPFKVLMPLLITYLLSPLPLQVGFL